MKEITLHREWLVKAPLEDVFRMMTDFERFPEYFPKVAEKISLSSWTVLKCQGETEIIPQIDHRHRRFGIGRRHRFALYDLGHTVLVRDARQARSQSAELDIRSGLDDALSPHGHRRVPGLEQRLGQERRPESSRRIFASASSQRGMVDHILRSA